MSLIVNGEAYTAPQGATVRDLVAERTGREVAADGRSSDGDRLGIAVALDDAVVPRSAWATTPLPERGTVEIVTAVQGG